MAVRFYLLVLLSFLNSLTYGQTVYFQQDFSTGSNPASYTSATPNVSQFTEIIATGTSSGTTTAAIINNELVFDRTSDAGQGRFVRASDFSPMPTSLYIQFSITVSPIDNQNNAAFISFGGSSSGFNNNGTIPANNETYVKLNINFAGQSQANQYLFRDVNANKNSPNLTGKKDITWILNKTGTELPYVAPGGGTETVANDRYDLWIDNVKVFDDVAVLTPSVELKRFKMLFNNGAGKISFDNLLIRNVAGVLPVKLVTFQAKPQGNQVQLNWSTAWERDASHFGVERSQDLDRFVPIGQVKAKGTTDQRMTYSFIDEHPMPGPNYYRLVQVDTDNRVEQSKVVSAVVDNSQPALDIIGNPIQENTIRFTARNLQEAKYRLLSPIGNDIPCHIQSIGDGILQLTPLFTLPTGTYTLQAIGEGVRLSRKILVQ